MEGTGGGGEVTKCTKCDGAGWLWWHELDNYAGHDPTALITDDTRYPCDKCSTEDGGCGEMIRESENAMSDQTDEWCEGVRALHDSEPLGTHGCFVCGNRTNSQYMVTLPLDGAKQLCFSCAHSLSKIMLALRTWSAATRVEE
jgi:hypothetical protein